MLGGEFPFRRKRVEAGRDMRHLFLAREALIPVGVLSEDQHLAEQMGLVAAAAHELPRAGGCPGLGAGLSLEGHGGRANRAA